MKLTDKSCLGAHFRRPRPPFCELSLTDSAREQIRFVSISARRPKGNAPGQVGCQQATKIAAQFSFAVVAEAKAYHSFTLIAGLSACDVDCANWVLRP